MSICSTIITIIILEIILTIIYTIITPKERKAGLIDYKSIVKGLVERAFLTYSLISELPHALTLFGALKLGTRLKHTDNTENEKGRKREEAYNNYYLIGNIISVTLSIVYHDLIKHIK